MTMDVQQFGKENYRKVVLILAGRDDHMIMPSLFHEEYDLLPNGDSTND